MAAANSSAGSSKDTVSCVSVLAVYIKTVVILANWEVFYRAVMHNHLQEPVHKL